MHWGKYFYTVQKNDSTHGINTLSPYPSEDMVLKMSTVFCFVLYRKNTAFAKNMLHVLSHDRPRIYDFQLAILVILNNLHKNVSRGKLHWCGKLSFSNKTFVKNH